MAKRSSFGALDALILGVLFVGFGMALPWLAAEEGRIKVVLVALLAIVAWYLVGIAALVAADDEEQSLYAWVSDAPYDFVKFLAILAWPLLVWHFRGHG